MMLGLYKTLFPAKKDAVSPEYSVELQHWSEGVHQNYFIKTCHAEPGCTLSLQTV